LEKALKSAIAASRASVGPSPLQATGSLQGKSGRRAIRTLHPSALT
jgi:hypothetical protein